MIWIKQRWWIVAFALLTLANATPLTSKYLPFTDLQGHIGLAGALAHFGDDAAQIRELYTLNPRVLSSMLYEYIAWGAAPVVGVSAMANLLLFVSVVLGVPLGLLAMLRVYGRDPRLVLLIFPLLFHRSVWFGFINFLLSVPLVLVGLALLRRSLDASSWRASLWPTLGAIGVSLLLVAAHFFGAGIFVGLALIVVVLGAIDARRLAILARGAVCLVPSVALIAIWLSGVKAAGKDNLWQTLAKVERSPEALGKLFVDWSINGYASRIDDVVLAVAALGIVIVAGWSLVRRRQGIEEGFVRRIEPVVLLLACIAMFIVLPMGTADWWAVNVRLIPFIWAFVILSLPRARQPVPAWVLAPSIAAGLFWGAYLGWDFRAWYNRVEMAGFDQAIEAIPKGRTVHVLFPRFEDESHYAHFPMAHIGAHYVVRRGGLVVPMIDAVPEQVVIRPGKRPSFAPWGMASRFAFRVHGQWDYFLVKSPVPGRTPLPNVFRGAPPGAVELVAEHGLWRTYVNRARMPKP